MQVATIFRDNVKIMGSANTMNPASESFMPVDETETESDQSPPENNADTSNNFPMSVSSLVSLASIVLNGNDSYAKKKVETYAEFLKKNEKKQIESQDILTQASIHQGEQYSKQVDREDNIVKEKLSQTFLPLLIDIKDRPTDMISQPISPSLDHSLESKKIDNIYKFPSNADDVSENPSTSHVTPMSFKENTNCLDKTFLIQIPDRNELQTNPHSSSIIASNIRETHGCATKLSDMDKTEAENLVIHEQDHANKTTVKMAENNLGMAQLLNSSKIERPKEQTEAEGEQQEQLNLQVHTRNEQNEIINKIDKGNHYSNHNFPECLRSELNVEDLSNQSHQISDSRMDDIQKMERMPTNINLSQHTETLQQYQNFPENQDHVQHQLTQHYFVHQDHLMHRHQQHHHHSDLMSYLHHQDQTTLQQPHHIRTYQHYQQQQQRLHQLPYPETPSPQNSNKHGPVTCIDDLMIDEFHDDPNNQYKILSPTVKHESQDDGYETSAGDVLTPNSHSSSHSRTPQHQIHSVSLLRTKCESVTPSHQTDQDPYNFIDDEINSNIRMVSPSSNGNGIPIALRQHNYESSSDGVVAAMRMEDQQMIDVNNTLHIQSSNTTEISVDIQTPKKRGRKKKSNDETSERPMVDGNLKPILQKERKKHDRFNGMPEEEVSKRTLPDHLTNNLDIIIIGINPGLFAAYKGHHYAGPGNHFWKCLYLSGLTHEQMTAEEDYKLLKIGIGFTNMVERATKGSADLTRKEIKEGSRILLEKLKRFRPKIAVFNGKLIFEVFSGKKDFNFGRQQECVEGTDTYMWVMPSSSARCAQLPRAADKVPFYTALKRFRDYLNGLIPHIDELECVFNEPKSKLCCEPEVKGRSLSTCTHFLLADGQNNEKECLGYNNSTSSTIDTSITSDMSANQNNDSNMQDKSPNNLSVDNVDNNTVCGIILQGLNSVNNINSCNDVNQVFSSGGQPEKKKRGRPKKIKGSDGADSSIPHKIRNTSSLTTNNNNILNLTLLGVNGEVPKKKRGRPKKIKIDNEGVLRPDLASNSNINGQVIGTTSVNNDIIVTNNVKNIVCGNPCSPNHIVNHQMLTMNTCNQYNTQSMPQQRTLHNQRLFPSPMHSPNTASSYCSIGINATKTPPTGNANLNNSNLGNNGSYHQQLVNSNNMQPHHHNQLLQRTQHQLQTVSSIYMQPSNETQHQQSKSPPYASSHSDLSAEISAAISSDRLCESQSESSPPLNTIDYDRPESTTNDEHNSHDLRFSSPSAAVEQRVDTLTHQINPYHNIYQGGNSSQRYVNSNNPATLCETRSANTTGDNMSYMVNNRTQSSNSNANTPQPTHNPSQQQNLHISDMSSKSLSGLESLVEQIPTISDNETQNQLTSIVGSVECRLKSESDESYPSPVSGGKDTGIAISGGLGCIYMPTYSNLNSSTPSPSSSVPSNSSIISPHHYPDSTYSTPNTCCSTTNSNENNVNYNSLASNFSVSSLTSTNYSSSYHNNIMAAPVVSSPHHVAGSSSGNSMYMDSHLPVAVSTIYPHPYAQHASYGAYNTVAPPSQPPTLHMPSPNYPYTYSNNSGYINQATHYASPTTPTGYLTSHPSMFDRIKPDIGYGGY